MLRITKQTDYGILLLTRLAGMEAGAVANAKELAADTHLPGPMVGKILKQLVREGILVSQRGVKGGYGLARPASEISVGDVIRVLEGPVAITECSPQNDGGCEHEIHCPLPPNWQRINAAIVKALRGISLADMASPFRGEADGSEHAGGCGDTPALRSLSV